MSENNKALVRAACKHLGERNLPALFALIHEEGSWSVPFRADRFQFGGFRDKAGVMALLTGFLAPFDSFSFTIQNMTAEEDRVVTEVVSEGRGPGSAIYRNNYILIFFIKDAMLHTVREYFDPFNVLAYVEQVSQEAESADPS